MTRKLYYEDVYLLRSTAHVVKVEGSEVVLDATCFYPEGGGQVGDRGTLGPFRVLDTQKRGGVMVSRSGLPSVAVNTEIVHHIEGDAQGMAPGDELELIVDEAWRKGCMAMHGGAHLVLAAVAEMFGESSCVTAGCQITPEQGRLDLQTEHKLGGETLQALERRVNEWVSSGAPVSMAPVDGVDEMFMWTAEALSPQLRMPCGGTHHRCLSDIGRLRLKRRREGRGIERIYLYPSAPAA